MAMGVSFQTRDHLVGGGETAPNGHNIIVAAPEGHLIQMLTSPCLSWGTLGYGGG